MSPPEQAKGQQVRFVSCTLEKDSQRAQLMVVEVVVTVRERETPCRPGGGDYNLTVRSESWKAPSLGCAELKRVTSIKKGAEPYAIVTTIEPEMVSRSEPYAALFAIPAGFVERRASEVPQELRRLKGDLRDTDSASVLDKANPSDVAPSEPLLR